MSKLDQAMETAADLNLVRVEAKLRDGRTQTFVLADLTMDWDMNQCEDAMEIIERAMHQQTQDIFVIDELREILHEKNLMDVEIKALIAKLEEERAPNQFNVLTALQRIRKNKDHLKLFSIFYLPEGLDYDPSNLEEYEEFYRKLKTQHLLGAIGHFFAGAGSLMAGGFRQYLGPLLESFLLQISTNADAKPLGSESAGG